jgi:hypothetical protein
MSKLAAVIRLIVRTIDRSITTMTNETASPSVVPPHDHRWMASGKCAATGCLATYDDPQVEVDRVVQARQYLDRVKFDPVNRPKHYADQADPAYEPIKVIEAWNLGFCLGNTVKYIARHGRKVSNRAGEIEDLEKARWYLDRRIAQLQSGIEEGHGG